MQTHTQTQTQTTNIDETMDDGTMGTEWPQLTNYELETPGQRLALDPHDKCLPTPLRTRQGRTVKEIKAPVGGVKAPVGGVKAPVRTVG